MLNMSRIRVHRLVEDSFTWQTIIGKLSTVTTSMSRDVKCQLSRPVERPRTPNPIYKTFQYRYETVGILISQEMNLNRLFNMKAIQPKIISSVPIKVIERIPHAPGLRPPKLRV